MSEYQYYEFAAVDRPLTGQQQTELRSRSTRATITASSFVNEYHWGNLKGDPLDWVERYFDAHVYSANWGTVEYPSCIVEVEIGFRLGRDLPPRDRPWHADEVMSAVDSACAAIEVAESRLANFFHAPDWDRVADNMANGAVVVGSGTRDWQSIDFSTLSVELEINGEPVVGKAGGHPSGDPTGPLVWLANQVRQEGGLQAGQIVITGSWTGVKRARAGDRVTGRFAGLGEVTLRFY